MRATKIFSSLHSTSHSSRQRRYFGSHCRDYNLFTILLRLLRARTSDVNRDFGERHKNQTIKSERKSGPAHFVRISTFTHFVGNWILILFYFNFVIGNLTWPGARDSHTPNDRPTARMKAISWPNFFTIIFFFFVFTLSFPLIVFGFDSLLLLNASSECEIGTFMDTPMI